MPAKCGLKDKKPYKAYLKNGDLMKNIFDEVQFCPKARQAIKTLVKDHRYDYIETGSLISIRKV